MPLTPPTSHSLRVATLSTTDVKVTSLHRISRFASGEPYFGKAGANRFDDGLPAKSKRFGTCYCGVDLETAIAETLLHDEEPVGGAFTLSYTDFSARYHLRFKGGILRLADITGVSLKLLGGDGSISTVTPYAEPQRWARALHQNAAMVDGLYYMSRHLNDRPAVVIFDRAAHKLGNATYTSLPKAKRVFTAATTVLHITFKFP